VTSMVMDGRAVAANVRAEVGVRAKDFAANTGLLIAQERWDLGYRGSPELRIPSERRSNWIFCNKFLIVSL